ncbi:MAG: type IV pilus secretin PilQ [Syntrophorhabdales bacterium]|jgi:type IV pilus assembly protein PilQ
MKKVVLLLFFAVLITPLVCLGQQDRRVSPKISFDFIDADIRNVLRALAEVSKKNMVISDDVKGKVTIKLENVSYDDALDAVLRNNDLAKVEDETVIRVMTAKKLQDENDRDTKYRLEFLREREARQKLEQEIVTETVYVNYADVTDVVKMIKGEAPSTARDDIPQGQAAMGPEPVGPEKTKGLLTPAGQVTTVKWDNAIIIKDTKDSVANVVRLIKEHDVQPEQIQIAARIVLATSTFSKELGIQWGASYNTKIRGETVGTAGARQVTGDSSSTTYTAPTGNLGIRNGVVSFPYNVNLPAAMGQGQGGSMGIYLGSLTDSLQLDVVLSALEAQDKGKVISSPKVITSDNHVARITQGTEIPYQSSSAQLGTNTMFKLAVMEIEVTPHIIKDGNIRLKIRAKDDEPDFDPRFTVPAVTKREAVTELLVKDGETVVLGGIFEVTLDDSTSGIPFLKDIPWLGSLFKHTGKTDNKAELLIFVTPTLLKNLYTEKTDK